MKKTLNTITTPEHNYKAALISVYFGKFPYYFELTKKSAKFNKDFKWLIFTDQVKKRTVEGNLEFLPYNLDSLNKDVAALFKENLHISTNEMVCDTKVLWGELFHKYTKPFPWYGFTDLDCIYGDFDYFLPDEAFENYELITYRMSDGSLHGPLTLFKNTAKMRKLYTEIPDLKGMLSQGKRVESPDEKHLGRIITKKGIENYPGWEVAPKRVITLCRYGKRRVPAKWEQGKMFVESLVRENPEEKDLLGHTMILHIRESRGHFVDVTTDEVLPAIEKSYREQLKENEPGTFTLTEHNKMVHPLYLLTQYLPGLHHLKERYELKKIIVPAAIYKNRYEEYIKMLGLKLDVDINPNLQTAVDAKLGQDEITKRFITEIQNRITIDPSLPERVLLYGRTAVNAEIKDFARDRGFTTLAWENLTPLGQARVVRSAKEIIWTADAEIGNVVFTTPQTKIIQITNNIQNNPIKGIVSQLSKLFNKPWQFHLLPNESGSIPKIEEALD